MRAVFEDFWKKTVEEIHENTDVERFNKMRLELIPIADDILNRLRKHIEKYVAREKI